MKTRRPEKDDSSLDEEAAKIEIGLCLRGFNVAGDVDFEYSVRTEPGS